MSIGATKQERWSTAEVQRLLELRFHDGPEFQLFVNARGRQDKRQAWDRISERLHVELPLPSGDKRSPMQCEQKLNNLRKEYVVNKEGTTGSDMERRLAKVESDVAILRASVQGMSNKMERILAVISDWDIPDRSADRSDSRLDALLAESRAFQESGDVAPKKIPPGLRVEAGSVRRLAIGTNPYAEKHWSNEATTLVLDSEHVSKNARLDDDNERRREGEDGEEDEYSTDDFENDDITEWKKGVSIGAGSYGTVYLARDEETGCLMAVKEIRISEESECAIREATREVELLRSLKHEHIVKYLGCHVDSEAQTLSIFTEWVPGGSLEHNRKLFGGNERVVRRFTHQLLSGVAYLHSKSIIHQDIKPTNILVDQNGVVKIADFGSSRLTNSATTNCNASGSNRSLRGTPNYMAPEVIKQSAGRSRKADIWSIGCTVLRLLTGRPLWGDRRFDSQAALLYYIAHLDVLPPLPDNLSSEAHEFISACLQIDTANRPSAADLLKFSFVQHGGH
ncbi:hypothetical protein BBO99_00007462, partial [Phytophthora kernoviae]